MEYTFLKEEIESILLFATAPVYLIILSILQSKNLKLLDRLKNKKLVEDQKRTVLANLTRLKWRTLFYLLPGLILHQIGYLVFVDSIRGGYFISMVIMYLIYAGIAFVNFYLRGAGVLKDIGKFNGLPGN